MNIEISQVQSLFLLKVSKSIIKIKKTHILVVDNITLGSSLYIVKYNYPYVINILEKYEDIDCIYIYYFSNNGHLVTKGKTNTINSDLSYIKSCKKVKINKYVDMFNDINKIYNNDTQVTFITGMTNLVSKLNDILDTIPNKIIINNDIEGKLSNTPKNIAYSIYPLVNNNIKGVDIFGINNTNINMMVDNCILINSISDNIYIDDENVNFTSGVADIDSILSAVSYYVDNIKDNKHFWQHHPLIKKLLLSIIKGTNTERKLIAKREYIKFINIKFDVLMEQIEIMKNNVKKEYSRNILDFILKSKILLINKQTNVICERIDNNLKILIKIEEYNNKVEIASSVNFTNSMEFFTSKITLTNWYEELQNNNVMGLIINVTHDGNEVGHILGVTNTFFPFNDYIILLNEHYEKKYNSRKLNGIKIFTGTIIGDGNAVIPLYINKQHWALSKMYINIALGMILTDNPINYDNKCINFMNSLFGYSTYLLCNNPECLNVTFITIYFAIFRTCVQMYSDRGYCHGIYKYVKKYREEPKNSYSVLCNCVLNNYFMDNELINIINRNIYKETDAESNVVNAIYKIYGIMGKIYKHYGSYSNFIKHMELNYGLVDCVSIIVDNLKI